MGFVGVIQQRRLDVQLGLLHLHLLIYLYKWATEWGLESQNEQ
jgi:hypothetical protein